MSPSAQDEADLLSSLFSQLDDAVLPRTLPPLPKTPVRPRIYITSSPSATKQTHRTPKRTAILHAAEDVDIEALVDGAENWDWDDMLSPVPTPKKSSPVKTKTVSRYAPNAQPREDTSTRCIVKEIHQDASRTGFEKTLIVEVVPGKERRKVILRDDWTNADVSVGDTLNTIGSWTFPPGCSTQPAIPTITVCAKHNLFIHHPDILFTATSLSYTAQCTRRPLLSSMVRSSSDFTPSLVWGNMLHEVVQSCLVEERWDDGWVNERIAEVVQNGLGELVRVNMSAEQATFEVKARAKGLKAFAEKYIAPFPKPNALLTNTRAPAGQMSYLAISQVHDIEEDIWSPTYGLKGMIDASVQAVVRDVDDKSTPFARAAPVVTETSSPMPFEIKTGRVVAGMEHRAQTMLYTLLMSERYGEDVTSGLLYYTQSEEVVRVPAARNEIRALLVARNEMAGYTMRRMRATGKFDDPEAEDAEYWMDDDVEEPFLPPTIDDSRTCGRCYVLDTCMLYRKAVERVVDQTSQIADMYALKTAHLTDAQMAFFKKWEALISLEEQDLVRFKKELWTMSAAEREEKGRCFSDMVLDPAFTAPPRASAGGVKIHRYTYRFTKAPTLRATSLLNGHLGINEPVTVSVEPDLLALARGFILHLAPDAVVVGVDHELDEAQIAARARPDGDGDGRVVFRIDKDELFGGMGRLRDNLAQMFYAGGDWRGMELIVDLQPPRFAPEGEGDASIDAGERLTRLNDDQLRAVDKVLRTEDYSLILGMPGTGKTTVIAAIIEDLVRAGKTVLLTSYTHSAVDTILMKLHNADFGILRLGNLDKVDPAVRKYTLAEKPPARTLEQLEHQVISPPVVATTCLSIDHPLFARRRFDYCIVDEASQITLPTCIGPLRFAKRFVLVGDHFQLPPLVKNHAARKGGLDVSLFRRLSDAHPNAVVDLRHQYRMNEDIMLLSNRLIYSDRLQCGSKAIASQALKLPKQEFLDTIHVKSDCKDIHCWLRALLDPNLKAVFVDTDLVPARDSRVGDLVENKGEARLVQQITEALLHSGVREDQIGVLSLYRQQLKLLSHLLQGRSGLEIITADRSQGRDKDCIIISMVRSNEGGHVGDLVKDWRRMNVSFTRARKKLIVVGSRGTLQGAPLLAEFFELMQGKGWILALPPGADRLHEVHGAPTPRKRRATALEERPETGEAEDGMGKKPAKLRKSVGATEEGLLKGRPLLRDVMNGAR